MQTAKRYNGTSDLRVIGVRNGTTRSYLLPPPLLLTLKQSHYRPREFEEVEASRFQGSSKVVSPTQRPPLPSRKYSWYSFLLEAESTPGPQCGRKDVIAPPRTPLTATCTTANQTFERSPVASPVLNLTLDA